MLADSSAELKRDNFILENYGIDDLDPKSIRQFRQLFASSRAGHPWHALEDVELLKKIGAYRTDRKSGQVGVTLAGLLMFGKGGSIKEQETLPDYSLSGNIIIELNTEKFVFSNPGTLLVSLQQYYAGGVSECRNPSLQQMFMLIGRAEKAGSGVDKIMTGWQESHWRRPFIELESQPDRVKLTLPMFSVIPEPILNELDSIFEDVKYLTPDELTALSFCLIEGSISNHRLQYVLNRHSVDITGMLKKLCTSGYLESDNNGRWTIYEIKRKVDTSGRKVDTSGRKVDTSGRKVDTSGRKVNTFDIRESAPRLNREELEMQIMQVCKNNYIKMEDVAMQIGKSVDYLKNKIFPAMIKAGKLEKHFPFTHNHPEQGYKTVDKYVRKL